VQMTQSPDFLGEIEFRNLNFGYNGVSVLKDINLRIPAGSSWPSSDRLGPEDDAGQSDPTRLRCRARDGTH